MSDYEIIDRRFHSYILPAARLEEIASGCRWAEGPVWFGDAACLLFSDIPNNRVLRWIEGSGVSVYRQPANFENGHTRDLEGRLISCSHGLRAVTRTEHDGSITVLAGRYNGHRLNSPNDVVVKTDGTIWFTDPHYGIASDYEGQRAEQELPCNVYRLDPSRGQLEVVAETFDCPNGICFSPDERTVYIAETGKFGDPNAKPHIRAFDVVESRRLVRERLFHTVEPGAADGFRCDTMGNLWTSAGDGVHCLTPQGELLGKIHVPQCVSNVTFGGQRRNRLFICATSSVYSIFLNTQGTQQP